MAAPSVNPIEHCFGRVRTRTARSLVLLNPILCEFRKPFDVFSELELIRILLASPRKLGNAPKKRVEPSRYTERCGRWASRSLQDVRQPVESILDARALERRSLEDRPLPVANAGEAEPL